MHLGSFLILAFAAALAAGHPGHDEAKEAAQRREMLLNSRSDLSHCAEEMRRRGLHDRNIERRTKLAQGLMKKRGLEVRQVSVLNKSHESTAAYTPQTDLSQVFAGNKSCVLAPEQIDGPYYVAGEKIRRDVTEGQAGVPLALDVQVVDLSTCKPLEGIYVEVWHANATGVYSGVAVNGNGGGAADKSNLNATWLRGAQKADTDGAVQFSTIFPGAYAGRTVHIHVAVHLNATALANGTLINTAALHVGQLYFDQSLIADVVAQAPYSTNRQQFVTNKDDFLLLGAAASSDPIVEHVRLGSHVRDGLLAWIGFGVNTSFVHEIIPAATSYESGGETNKNAGMGLPGGFPPGVIPPGFPPGAMPPGFPSGLPPGFQLPPGAFPGPPSPAPATTPSA